MQLTPKTSEVPGRIVHAAIALFSRQGYHGTSTREIARVADVSEVTVFRYFERKEDIFWSALRASFSGIQPRLEQLGKTSEQETPEVVLPQILSLLVDVATFSPELVQLIVVAYLEFRGKAEEICGEHLTPLFSAIAGYLAKNIENGRVRNLNPAIVTAAMALTIIAQPALSSLVEGSRALKLGGREAISEYSKFWLNILVSPVIEPAQNPPA